MLQCTSTSGGGGPRGKRQAGGGEDDTPPFIPAERMQELARLAGRAFNYDDGTHQTYTFCIYLKVASAASHLHADPYKIGHTRPGCHTTVACRDALW